MRLAAWPGGLPLWAALGPPPSGGLEAATGMGGRVKIPWRSLQGGVVCTWSPAGVHLDITGQHP
eukprot:gene1056-4029_t